MKIIIAGGDKSGQNLMKFFQNDKDYSVTVIEADAKTCEWISEAFPEVEIVWGNANHPSVLKEAKAEEADVFIAVIGDDQSNILAAKAAKKLGIPKVVARVTDPAYRELAELMDFDDILDPAEAVAAEIVTRLQGVDFVRLMQKINLDVEFSVLKVAEKKEISGKNPCEINSFFDDIIQPMFVVRNGNYQLPSEIESLEAGDEIIYLFRRKKNKKRSILGL